MFGWYCRSSSESCGRLPNLAAVFRIFLTFLLLLLNSALYRLADLLVLLKAFLTRSIFTGIQLVLAIPPRISVVLAVAYFATTGQ